MIQSIGRESLILAAIGSFAVALLHLVIIPIGAPAYRYFGAPDLAVLEERGSWTPAVMTLVLVFLFSGFGLYALSGARKIRRLPLLLAGLIAIGSLYALRGLAVFPQLVERIGGAGIPSRHVVFSLVALAIGIAYLIGIMGEWRLLRKGGAR
ncbi:MAG TPA: hypothetical protein VF756_29890 [Thermoanaerobaculia bacterium]